MEKLELARRVLWSLVEIFSLGLVLLIFVYFLLVERDNFSVVEK